MITEGCDTETIRAEDSVVPWTYHECEGGRGDRQKKQIKTKVNQGGGQNLAATKAAADSEDHNQGTHSADYANIILTACFLPLPTREAATAAIMSWGTHGGCMGLEQQPAIRRKQRQNPGMVWKPPYLTCESLDSCLDLHCRDYFKGWKPLV